MKKILKTISLILFLVGLGGAVILGILKGAGVWEATDTIAPIISISLTVVGIGIGLVNIKNDEAVPFMVSILVLGLGSASLAIIPQINDVISSVFGNIAFVMIPAGIIVALTTIIKKSR